MYFSTSVVTQTLVLKLKSTGWRPRSEIPVGWFSLHMYYDGSMCLSVRDYNLSVRNRSTRTLTGNDP